MGHGKDSPIRLAGDAVCGAERDDLALDQPGRSILIVKEGTGEIVVDIHAQYAREERRVFGRQQSCRTGLRQCAGDRFLLDPQTSCAIPHADAGICVTGKTPMEESGFRRRRVVLIDEQAYHSAGQRGDPAGAAEEGAADAGEIGVGRGCGDRIGGPCYVS